MWATLSRAIGTPAIPTALHVILSAVHVVPWDCMTLLRVVSLTYAVCVCNSRFCEKYIYVYPHSSDAC